MADKLGLGSEVRELKIGQSFTNPKATAFHAIRCKSSCFCSLVVGLEYSSRCGVVLVDDFKPASVDMNKIATVGVGNNNQVTVTVPHLGTSSRVRVGRSSLTFNR